MEKIHNIVEISISSSGVYMGIVLWVVEKDNLMIYEQEYVVDVFCYEI